jgi:hypothetical protein
MIAEGYNPIRILIADDHELMRCGLRSMLATRPDWQVCGEHLLRVGMTFSLAGSWSWTVCLLS